MNRKVIPIFFAVDDNYVKIMHVALRSLVANASKKFNYNIHVICEGLTKENQASIKSFEDDNFKCFIEDLSKEAGERAKLMEGKYYNGRATYYRAFIPRLFPQYDKILYLDSDIVLNGDVSELFNTDIKDNYLIAVLDGIVAATPIFLEYVHNFLNQYKYFNAGVLVMNSKALRAMDFETKFFDLLSKFKFEIAPDQDCFQILCMKRVKLVGDEWNRMSLLGVDPKRSVDQIKLVHFNLAAKPWILDNCAYGELWWKHAKNTQFYNELLNIKKTVTPKDFEKSHGQLNAIMNLAAELSKGPSIYEILADIDGVHVHDCSACGACCAKRKAGAKK